MEKEIKMPMAFIWRRLHSLLGAWLVIYLFEHLLVNSQAALYFRDGGSHFIAMVNSLEAIPFLPAIEITFIGLPFFIHIIWGVIYLRQAKLNSFKNEGTKPSLYQYRRNRAFSWQRITSWLLIVGVVFHVIHMRFLHAPQELAQGGYRVEVERDPKLEKVANSLGVELIQEHEKLYAFSKTPGAGFFLTVRESFKSLPMVIFYSLFVICACYHAFNGVWTALITWGISMTQRAQRNIKIATVALMWLTIGFGVFSAIGMYVEYVR